LSFIIRRRADITNRQSKSEVSSWKERALTDSWLLTLGDTRKFLTTPRRFSMPRTQSARRGTATAILIQFLAITSLASMFATSFRRAAGPIKRVRSTFRGLTSKSTSGGIVKALQKQPVGVASSRRNMLFRLGALAAFATSSSVAAAAGKHHAPIVEYFRSDYKPSDFNVSQYHLRASIFSSYQRDLTEYELIQLSIDRSLLLSSFPLLPSLLLSVGP
jgi:hypothetical protein